MNLGSPPSLEMQIPPPVQSPLVVQSANPWHGVVPSTHSPPPSAVEPHTPLPPQALALHCVNVEHVCPSHSGFGFMVHAPDVQTSPAAHITPQPPQLFGSPLSSTHVPSQEVWPGGHTETHIPELQVCPLEHVTPHAPQLLASDAKSVHTDGSDPPKQQSLLPAAHTASLWLATCAGTAGAPTVMTCTLAGLPGGK